MPESIFALLFAAIGHLSFALTFLSYAQKNLIRLRMIAVVSLTFGLVYNTYINIKMPPGDDIRLVLGWLSLFLLQNLYLLVREIKDTLEVPLGGETKLLLAGTFPKMHSKDWQTLLAAAKKIEAKAGEIFLSAGDPTRSLRLSYEGLAEEVREGVRRDCAVGTLWGELTFVLGEDCFNASPVDLIAKTDMKMYEWDYAVLRDLCNKNTRLNVALQHGFIYSAGLKHGLLWNKVMPKEIKC